MSGQYPSERILLFAAQGYSFNHKPLTHCRWRWAGWLAGKSFGKWNAFDIQADEKMPKFFPSRLYINTHWRKSNPQREMQTYFHSLTFPYARIPPGIINNKFPRNSFDFHSYKCPPKGYIRPAPSRFE